MSASDAPVAALGGGLIGQSWTALFLAAGRSVTVHDPAPGSEPRIRGAVEAASSTGGCDPQASRQRDVKERARAAEAMRGARREPPGMRRASCHTDRR